MGAEWWIRRSLGGGNATQRHSEGSNVLMEENDTSWTTYGTNEEVQGVVKARISTNTASTCCLHSSDTIDNMSCFRISP